jgi:hypothetical protein
MIYDSNKEPIPIVVLKANGDYVGEYDNISDAAFKLSLEPIHITLCLKGFSASCKGYIFIKKEQYNPLIKITRKSILRKRNFLNNKT